MAWVVRLESSKDMVFSCLILAQTARQKVMHMSPLHINTAEKLRILAMHGSEMGLKGDFLR